MTKKDELEPEKKERQTKGIMPIDISAEMRESYLDYAMSVITTRALPDVRDGLKPVHRRILFSMNDLGLTASAKFRKSAAVVGDVLGKYHPHGDSSVYEAMVKMAQFFSYRYPLVKGQGNFGSIDGDPAAAMRYTEAKMSKISAELLRDIDKDTVDFSPNYDGTRLEPVVLPAAVPTLLLNGTLGIAVGMATNIPPHNLRELIDATIHLIDNDNVTTEDLMQYVKGPDFPTGGMIFGSTDIHQAYASGRGGIVVRGHAEVIEDKHTSIIITSLPYRVNKAELIMKIADLVRDKKIDGIKGLRDESTMDIRVVIDLKAGSYPQKVLNYLYKHTDLENTFHLNVVALVDGVPQTLSLKSILNEFIKHRQDVVVRRTKYDLRKAQERAHILEGLKKALDHIDEVIKIIKASKDTPTARENLMKRFKFTLIQAIAILEMRLQKLAGLERQAIEDELKEKIKLIKHLQALLASAKKIFELIKDELMDVRDKFGDERRTIVMNQKAESFSIEDMVPDEESILVFTRGGYVKRTNPSEFKNQKRGGVGVVDLNTKEEDFISIFLSATTHNDLLFFSDQGKVYQIKMYEFPEAKRATKGKSIMNFLSLEQDEKITSILAMPKEVKEQDALSLMLVTKNGVVKKVSAASFKDVRRGGLIAMTLNDGDELLSSMFVEKGDGVVLATKVGQSIHFVESDVREMGRTAAGVRAIKLGAKDEVIGASVNKTEEESSLLVVSANGYGKQTKMAEYKQQKRGGSGIKTAKVTTKTGELIGAIVTTENYSEIVAISKKGQVIRTDLSSIPSLARQTQGVRVMKLKAGDSIASLVCI